MLPELDCIRRCRGCYRFLRDLGPVHSLSLRQIRTMLPANLQRYVRIGVPLVVVRAFLDLSGGLVGEEIATASRMVM